MAIQLGTKILDAATVTGAGLTINTNASRRAIQAIVAGTGSVSATVLIEVSLDNSTWMTLSTITLTGTTSASDGTAVDAPWLCMRANVSAVSGTGAAVTVYMVAMP